MCQVEACDDVARPQVRHHQGVGGPGHHAHLAEAEGERAVLQFAPVDHRGHGRAVARLGREDLRHAKEVVEPRAVHAASRLTGVGVLVHRDQRCVRQDLQRLRPQKVQIATND